MKSGLYAIVLAAAAGGVQAAWTCILPKSYGGTAVNQFGDCVQNGNLNDIYPCRHQAVSRSFILSSVAG
ncbi:uncharacterized protein RHO25_012430 [Cercospora beticola]|uniref:CBM1 domain-containing protein n=1 Tax=Cercospora beticola TaxID=122368 RepID=A0ABZ0P7K0_CERBT|nr:hypothetical protein RHO25_012430 [Cercospora beticola]